MVSSDGRLRRRRGRRADPTALWLATGTDFPDALAAGPAVAALGHTLLLVDGTDLDRSPPTREVLEDRAGALEQLRVLGGRNAVRESVMDQMRAAIEGPDDTT